MENGTPISDWPLGMDQVSELKYIPIHTKVPSSNLTDNIIFLDNPSLNKTMTNFMPQSDSRNDPAFKSLEASRLGPADQKRLTFTDINDWVNITLKQHFRKDVKKVIDFIPL